MQRQYSYNSNQPGCGGCLLIVILLLLATGGWQAVGNFVSVLIYSGLFGVIVLFAAFFGFTKYIQSRATAYEQSQSETHNRFVFLLVNILVCIAKADGHFTKSELRTMLNFFQHSLHYNQEQMYWVKQLIKEARDEEQDLDALLTEFRNRFAYEPRLILLELIYQLIFTKSPAEEAELNLARKIGQFLSISEYERRTMENKYRYGHQKQRSGGVGGGAPAEQQYYAVLGVEQGADFAAIKKAYRKLSMQYHPDKVAHLGDEFKGVAEEKMKEINAAYDHFRRKFEGS
ncbi:MAG: DnaJ domain-containing protein [Candidatus Electrothrix sp. GW3-4]|uniref:DnaJ domain-containing protein n=1 Tax=Candidatus Electrothrix sp. GW3-4 TaxID=3126740 RepID=UPI0030D1A300